MIKHFNDPGMTTLVAGRYARLWWRDTFKLVWIELKYCSKTKV